MVTFKSNIDQIVKAVQEKADTTIAAAQSGLVKGVRRFEAKMIKEQFSGRPGLNVGDATARDSWFVLTSGDKMGFSAKLSYRPNAWYIKVHQHYDFDGTINAKDKKLTIPLNDDAKRMRKDTTDLRSENLKFIVSKNGNALLGLNDGKKGFIPMFVLKDSVDIPKRLHITESFESDAPKMILEEIYKAIDKGIDAGRIAA